MEKQYRVWWVINPPNPPHFTSVSSPEEGLKLIKEEIQRQLNSPVIWGNAFGLETFEDGEWSEWYDEGGFDIMEVLRGDNR